MALEQEMLADMIGARFDRVSRTGSSKITIDSTQMSRLHCLRAVSSQPSIVEELIILCDHLLILGRVHDSSVVRNIELRFLGGSSPFSNGILAFDSLDEGTEGLTPYVGIISLDSITRCVVSELSFQAVIPGFNSILLTPMPYSFQDLMKHTKWTAIRRLFKQTDAAWLKDIFSETIKLAPPAEAAGIKIHNVTRVPTAIVLEGSVEAIAGRNIHIVCGDLSSCAPNLLLEAGQVRTSIIARTQKRRERFIATLPTSSPRPTYYITESVSKAGVSTFYGPYETGKKYDMKKAFSIIKRGLTNVFDIPPDRAEAIYAPMATIPRRDVRVRKHFFSPSVALRRPIISIIIPFYGDAFFITIVYYLQRLLDDRFEIVIVVDDPSIWTPIFSFLNSRTNSVRVPLRLLGNSSNTGYGRANNMGANHARGKVLFFMNSDVLITNLQPLIQASDDILATPHRLIAGFVLAFEDNTIQHNGIEFSRSPRVHNLYLAEHRSKGLPLSLHNFPATRTVPAVTGALLGISTSLFQALGGFDTIYEHGDFEDCDLCLRGRQIGARSQLYNTTGYYHLERQSFAHLGDEDFKSMITYLNCIRFNRRWQTVLSGRTFRIRTSSSS